MLDLIIVTAKGGRPRLELHRVAPDSSIVLMCFRTLNILSRESLWGRKQVIFYHDSLISGHGRIYAPDLFAMPSKIR